MERKIIGLTGTYCAGKNHVASLFEKNGIPVLELDKLGHLAIEAEKDLLIERFGKEILAPNNLIDRKKLGQRVFARAEELAALEEIIHPWVNKETMDWINSREEEVCAINAALLHRSSAFEYLNCIIIVQAPVLVRLLRAKKRDKLPWLPLIKRFRSQRDFDSQYLRGKTDIYRVSNFFTYGNSGKKLEGKIEEILSLRGVLRV
ncbi:MAG: dephospho-CoA kinase [Treponema sp.]|nr:dephospho-CoA kinase [Treponema sp.]